MIAVFERNASLGTRSWGGCEVRDEKQCEDQASSGVQLTDVLVRVTGAGYLKMISRGSNPSVPLRARGQAAVETALVMPLVVFLIAAILQLTLIQNARIMTQYAAFTAVRAGAVYYGDCERMSHAAAAALMPAVHPFTGTGPAAAGLASAFALRHVSGSVFKFNGPQDDNHNREIFWLQRPSPTVAAVAAMPDPFQNNNFDDPEPGQPQFRLEAQLTFWFPLRIPFANWILARMTLAHWGLSTFVSQNVIINNGQITNYGDNVNPPTFAPAIGTEMAARVAAGQYEFPLTASYTMRMMTPVRKSNFTTQDCTP